VIETHLAPTLRTSSSQEVRQMALDMTAQLVPMMWMLIGMMVVSGVSLFAARGSN